jgi:hypothetical protein
MALEGPGPRFSILGPANKTTLQDDYSKFFHPKLTNGDEKWHDYPIRSKFPSKILPQGILILVVGQQRPKHVGLGFSGQESNISSAQITFVNAR